MQPANQPSGRRVLPTREVCRPGGRAIREAFGVQL